jgi:hypothetical protein
MIKDYLGSITLLLAAGGWALAEPGLIYAPAGRVTLTQAPAEGAAPAQPGASALVPAVGEAAAMAGSGTAADRAREALRDDHEGPGYRFWGSAEYLYWWTKSAPNPLALATAAPATSTGAIGLPGTRTVLGGSSIDYGETNGGRLTVGTWLDCRHVLGVEVSAFLLEEQAERQAVNSTASGAPLLARPFFDVLTGVPSALLVASPGAFSGGVAVNSSSGFWGYEINGVRNLASCPDFSADLLFGYRYLDLEEDLDVFSRSTALSNAPVFFPPPGTVFTTPGTSLTLADHFGARNQFYGGQLGGRAEYRFGRAFVGVLGKVALGTNHESVTVAGNSVLRVPGAAAQTATGGLLALGGANIGRATTNWFTVVPEAQLQLGFQLSDSLQAFVGYSFLYMSDVVRPASQVNPFLNPRFLPASPAFGSVTGSAEPTRFLRQNDFWAQGVNFGVSFRY